MRSARRREAGFSLIEMLTVTAVAAVVLMLVGQLVAGMQRGFATQRAQVEAIDNARAALDTMVRLVRMAGNNPRGRADVEAVHPDVDGNGLLDSLGLVADWNPADGDFDDPYESVLFFVSQGQLRKLEAGDPPEGVEFAPDVEALRVRFFDTGMGPIADPIATPGAIAFTELTLQLRPAAGAARSAPIEITSGASLRGRE